MFKTPYNAAKYPIIPEKNTGPKLVETAGYIPAKTRIENLILAGRRLDQYRREQFDFHDPAEPDDFVIDPTRRPGYDLADASQDAIAVTERLREQKNSKKKDPGKIIDQAPGDPVKPSQTAPDGPDRA